MSVIYYLLSGDSILGLVQSSGEKTSSCFRSERVNFLHVDWEPGWEVKKLKGHFNQKAFLYGSLGMENENVSLIKNYDLCFHSFYF